MKAFQAHAKGGSVTATTPRAAALAFFERYPNRRKCSITSGEADGHFFTVRYGRASLGDWPQTWADVTRRTAVDLPDQGAP
jgi:hypothetical protein